MAEWSLPAAHDVVAERVPERDMLVCGSVRRSYAAVAERTRKLAGFLVSNGLGARRERAQLDRWECGQDPVALVLRNCAEYIESMLACYRARAVPFNVNHHYTPGEVDDLFRMVGPRAVIYHRSLAPLVGEALGAAVDDTVLVVVDDGSDDALLPGSVPYEDAVSEGSAEPTLPDPSPDDLYMVCTGGTTGLPKAVLWRQADIFVAAMNGRGFEERNVIDSASNYGGATWFPTAPMMHAAAQWTAFSGLHGGATLVLHDAATGGGAERYDARTILETAEREKVSLMSIVGDAFARPIVEELRRRRYDLSSLGILATGGAATSEQHKEALLSLLPDLTIVDGYGASETGGMAFGARNRSTRSTGFAPGEGATVISADRTRFLEPGEDEIGWTARVGPVPLGYLGDPAATERTFPIIEGRRVSVPGDRARREADGTIRMLGRDATVVNSGGEKVFVEEVEEVLRHHHDVVDALVVGRPSDRFGQEVVAVVQVREESDVSPRDLREHVAESLARFKAPRAVAICDVVPRHANGKADYARARALAEQAVDATIAV